MKKTYKLLLGLAVLLFGLQTGCAAAGVGQTEAYPGSETEGLLYDSAFADTEAAAERETSEREQPGRSRENDRIKEEDSYTGKEEVALYLQLYGHLPDNYITKKEAKSLGWDSSQGNLWDVAPGKSIGGDYFGNYEGLLPEVEGRDYFECDIDYEGGFRNEKRIIYSDDGLIYYTEDHYESFEQLYGG